MAIVDARTWLQHLSEADCWDLLAAVPVGRVGIVVEDAPEIYPVNHVVDGRSVVFRTDPGSKLRGLYRVPSVCFEVDGFDLPGKTGWSVLLKGQAHELGTPEDLRHVAGLGLEFWTYGDKSHWIRITPTEITGRRVITEQEEA